jgi:para-nitrobenzyl esterase
MNSWLKMKAMLNPFVKKISMFVCALVAMLNITQAQTNPHTYEVKALRNLRYAEKPGGVYAADTSSDRLLDLYLPIDEGGTKKPVILFIHGGGFGGGDKSSLEKFWRDLASNGFAVISANYRLYLKHHKTSGASAIANMGKGLRPNGKFHPELQKGVTTASDDATRVLEWIKNNAGTYQMDVRRVAVSGGSAGAMAVLHLAFASGQKALPIRAVVNMWGGLQDAAVIKAGAPPLLTFHGDQDNRIHVDYGRALDSQMKKVGAVSELYVLKDEGHAIYKIINKDHIGTIVSFLRRVMP